MAGEKRGFSWFGAIRLTFLDAVTLALCSAIATELHGYSIFSSHITLSDAIPVMASCLICLSFIGGYEPKRNMTSLRYVSEHILAMCAVLIMDFIIVYGFSSYSQSVKPGRTVLLLAILFFTPLSLTYRYYLSIKEAWAAAARFFYVIGTPELVYNLKTICLEAEFRHPLRFVHALTKANSPEIQQSPAHETELSSQEISLTDMHHCDGVIIDLSASEPDETLTQQLLNLNLHSVPVYPVELFIESFLSKIDLSHVTLAAALDGTFQSDDQKSYGKLKSFIDGFLAAVLLLLTLPLFFLIAIIVKLQDYGPVFFIQERTGRFEKSFLLYKFRTMSISSSSDSPLYTAICDSRITKVGRILRLLRLDELPQLWNVVKGDMSIIGPRAEWTKLVEEYEQHIPFYHLRHIVKPGITGWAQVNYGYGASCEDTFEKLQYDLYYIKHYSPQLDAAIILKTAYTILSASGR